MNIFEGVILNCVYLLFPIAIYLIITAYTKYTDNKIRIIILDIALFSSLYLLFRHGYVIFPIYPMILFSIPLLIAYLKRRNITAILISILLIIYYHNTIGMSVVLLTIEYTLYFLVYSFYNYKRKVEPVYIISSFSIIKAFIMSFEMFLIFSPNSNIVINFVSIFSMMVLFAFIASLCLYFLNRGEEIIDLNSTIKELEKEKQLRASLFKITHEIKNPIAVCKGYLDMIDYNDKQKIEKYVPIIKDEISRTLILMDDFLDYTKVSIKKDEADLYMLLEDTRDITKPLFKKNNIKLELEIPDDEIYLDLDYNRMKQVLVNVFKNSIEAKDKKKDNNYLRVDVSKKNGEVVIKIKDNGVGMDSKTLSRVDEMFYTTKDKGTGLGVALSKEIVKMHQGKMEYDSVKGKYTLVTITLPINAN